MAFPSEESVDFPKRAGSLNFYDDETHQTVPNWKEIICGLEKGGVSILFKCKNYKPLLDWIRGMWNEKKSIKRGRSLAGTWSYWGFESIIWGKKK